MDWNFELYSKRNFNYYANDTLMITTEKQIYGIHNCNIWRISNVLPTSSDSSSCSSSSSDFEQPELEKSSFETQEIDCAIVSMCGLPDRPNAFFFDLNGNVWEWHRIREIPTRIQNLTNVVAIAFDGAHLYFVDKNGSFGCIFMNNGPKKIFDNISNALNVFTTRTDTFVLCENGKIYHRSNRINISYPFETDELFLIDSKNQPKKDNSKEFYEICPFSNVISICKGNIWVDNYYYGVNSDYSYELLFLLDNGEVWSLAPTKNSALQFLSHNIESLSNGCMRDKNGEYFVSHKPNEYITDKVLPIDSSYFNNKPENSEIRVWVACSATKIVFLTYDNVLTVHKKGAYNVPKIALPLPNYTNYAKSANK